MTNIEWLRIAKTQVKNNPEAAIKKINEVIYRLKTGYSDDRPLNTNDQAEQAKIRG